MGWGGGLIVLGLGCVFGGGVAMLKARWFEIPRDELSFRMMDTSGKVLIAVGIVMFVVGAIVAVAAG